VVVVVVVKERCRLPPPEICGETGHAVRAPDVGVPSPVLVLLPPLRSRPVNPVLRHPHRHSSLTRTAEVDVQRPGDASQDDHAAASEGHSAGDGDFGEGFFEVAPQDAFLGLESL
jgi:hypothetical protein